MGVTVAIATCGPQLEVAVRAASDRVASVIRLAGISPRSTLLVASLDLLMEDAGAEPTDIEHIVVSRGPGSFTGIRAGLATVAGLVEATAAKATAFDSLMMQAARCRSHGIVWTAQPGRRGEVYAQSYRIEKGQLPTALGAVEVLSVETMTGRSPWLASESLDIGTAERLDHARGAAEALIALLDGGAFPQPMEPLYVEGPPIHVGDRRG